MQPFPGQRAVLPFCRLLTLSPKISIAWQWNDKWYTDRSVLHRVFMYSRAIGFGNDECCVLKSLLVHYLRKMFSHVFIQYWNTIRHISYCLKLFGGEYFQYMQINPIRMIEWFHLDKTNHTFPCAYDMTYWQYVSSHVSQCPASFATQNVCRSQYSWPRL